MWPGNNVVLRNVSADSSSVFQTNNPQLWLIEWWNKEYVTKFDSFKSNDPYYDLEVRSKICILCCVYLMNAFIHSPCLAVVYELGASQLVSDLGLSRCCVSCLGECVCVCVSI
jgi:hypothetical protein